MPPATAAGASGAVGPGGGQDGVLLRLEHGEHQDASYFQVEQGTRLLLNAGTSLMGRHVYLYINYNVDDDSDNATFDRSTYYSLAWRQAAFDWQPRADGPDPELGAGALVDCPDLYAEVRLKRPGVFHYYFVYDTAETSVEAQGSGWVHVAPALAVPLDGLSVQTVLCKSLGPLARWPAALRPARDAGYTAVHITPVEARGLSGSSYCLAEHSRLDPGINATDAELDALLNKLRREWGMLFFSDIVLNHAANEAEFLESEPSASYNCANCPWLRPAALLDAALVAGSEAASRGEWSCIPVGNEPWTPGHVTAVGAELRERLLPALRLEEFWQADVQRIVALYRQAAKQRLPRPETDTPDAESEDSVVLLQDPQRRRLHASIDLELALRVYHRAQRGEPALLAKLTALNEAAKVEVEQQLRQAVDNLLGTVTYERVSSSGPRLRAVTADAPLFPRYFTIPSTNAPESIIWGPNGVRVMAHNGWISGGDARVDFAGSNSNGVAYFRRELVPWSDSVKLRYGDAPEESPALWKKMTEYVTKAARRWDGLRLDNAHATSPTVAERLLDVARAVRPNLYVLAELFTDSPHVDALFVNRLGVSALVRESLSAHSVRELGHLLHRWTRVGVGAPRRALPAPRASALPPAVLYDATHDNESPHVKRSVFHALAGAALTAALSGGAGSTRAVDDLVPHHVDVVNDPRLVPTQDDCIPEFPTGTGEWGMMAARREFNLLHRKLAEEGYEETFVDQMDGEVIATTRHNPTTRESVIVVAHCAWWAPAAEHRGRALPQLRVEGRVDEILLECNITHRDYPNNDRPFEGWGSFHQHPHFITGLSQYNVAVRTKLALSESTVWASVDCVNGVTTLHSKPVLPGTVTVVKVSLMPTALAAVEQINEGIGIPELKNALKEVTNVDLNYLLYRCEAEERDSTGQGVYHVPGAGDLVYCGVAGAQAMIEEMDLSHPLADNLRAGDWLMEYTIARVERSNLSHLAPIYRRVLGPLRAIPRYLQPAMVATAHSALYAVLRSEALARIAPPANSTAADLALTSFQLYGHVASAKFPELAPWDTPEGMQLEKLEGEGTLSAGLPHFACGYMRCWGRDTYIALPGLLLLPRRWAAARRCLLAGAALARPPLLPNLMAQPPRYNCRDAVWWWLRALSLYCEQSPEGHGILHAPATPGGPPLHRVVQDLMDAHLQGVVFREERAGPALDEHMSDAGFTVQVGVRPDSGFVFGGSDHNAGTWMDKMGSSDAAGTRGRPATPRDGSAIELVALCHAAVSWLARAHHAGHYPAAGARRAAPAEMWPWSRWAAAVADNFERHFWIPAEPSAADARPDLVHRRAIYKDTVGATRAYADYQLRPNQVLAMSVAPALFHPRRAWRALDAVRELLLAPPGLRTLDPADWAHRPHYDPAAAGDAATAGGYNYHQGPAWLWLLPHYVVARLHFAADNGEHARSVAEAATLLGALAAALRAEPWRGLPELVQGDGSHCAASCRSQAWSSAAALEAAAALAAARRARPLPRA